MRKVIVSMMVTLDGYFCGPDGEIDWHNVDAEFNADAEIMLQSADLLLFGRVTYQMMASYWPGPPALKDDPVIAGYMNRLSKIVFSTTLDHAEWENTRLVKDHIGKEVSKMKSSAGKDILIFGSGSIVEELAKEGLIDDYRIIINPVLLGKGRPLFKDIGGKINLKLLNTKRYTNGNVLLYYQVVK